MTCGRRATNTSPATSQEAGDRQGRGRAQPGVPPQRRRRSRPRSRCRWRRRRSTPRSACRGSRRSGEQFGTEGSARCLKVRYVPALAQWIVSATPDSVARHRPGAPIDARAGAAAGRAQPAEPQDLRQVSTKTARRNAVLNVAKRRRPRRTRSRPSGQVRRLDLSDESAPTGSRLYNENYNNLVVREYDGELPDHAGHRLASWKWRPHQTRVIARIIQSGNTYMAHAVGAGKTSAMIGAGMEMRRLGLVRKPMYAVPNHMLGAVHQGVLRAVPDRAHHAWPTSGASTPTAASSSSPTWR
jgi:hypothetical protein